MNRSVEDHNEQSAKYIVQELVRLGITQFCIAPGSRSTPLAIAAQENAFTKTTIHYDERSLSYFALGYGKATHTPACIIVTSGTAIANLYPAVIEAYYSHTPLFILTADRPPELQSIGANQTIDQNKFFSNHTRFESTIPPANPYFSKGCLGSLLSQAYFRSINGPSGPVAINFMFREPFFSQSKKPKIHELQEPTPHTKPYFSKRVLPEEDFQSIANEIDSSEKGLIIVGALQSNEEVESILDLAMQIQWPILADPLSTVRAIGRDASIIPYYNHILQSTHAKEKLIPSSILYLGGQLTSKPLSKWLKASNPKKYYHVGNFPDRHDPENLVSDKIEMEISTFCSLLKQYTRGRDPSRWFSLWKEYSLHVEETIVDFLDSYPSMTEPYVLHSLQKEASENTSFFFSNSLPIRYADTFFFPKSQKGMAFGNRGSCGIDGILSTALGVAKAKGRVTAVVGDLAFLHDVTALSLIKSENLPITFIILNNFGGGIFHFLPIAEKKQHLETLFATGHSQEITNIVKAYDIPIHKVVDHDGYHNAVEHGRNTDGPLIIEVISNRQANWDFHQEIETHMQKKLMRGKKEKELCYFPTKKEKKIVTL